MSGVKKCPKCSGRMIKGSEKTLNDAFRCTRPDSQKLEQYSFKIQPYYCERCGYIEFYKEIKEKKEPRHG